MKEKIILRAIESIDWNFVELCLDNNILLWENWSERPTKTELIKELQEYIDHIIEKEVKYLAVPLWTMHYSHISDTNWSLNIQFNPINLTITNQSIHLNEKERLKNKMQIYLDKEEYLEADKIKKKLEKLK